MRKLFQTLIIAFLFIFSLSFNVNAEDVTSINDLIEKAKELDGQRITIQGEVIGECMERGDYSWINVNDGTNGIGIWLRKSETVKILYYGSYKNKGDIVKITGIFHRACKEHGGEADIHSSTVEITDEGHPVKEQITSSKIIAAVILFITALLTSVYFLKQLKSKE